MQGHQPLSCWTAQCVSQNPLLRKRWLYFPPKTKTKHLFDFARSSNIWRQNFSKTSPFRAIASKLSKHSCIHHCFHTPHTTVPCSFTAKPLNSWWQWPFASHLSQRQPMPLWSLPPLPTENCSKVSNGLWTVFVLVDCSVACNMVEIFGLILKIFWRRLSLLFWSNLKPTEKEYFFLNCQNKLQTCCPITSNNLVYIFHKQRHPLDSPKSEDYNWYMTSCFCPSELAQASLMTSGRFAPYGKSRHTTSEPHVVVAAPCVQSKLLSLPLTSEEYRPVILQNVSVSSWWDPRARVFVAEEWHWGRKSRCWVCSWLSACCRQQALSAERAEEHAHRRHTYTHSTRPRLSICTRIYINWKPRVHPIYQFQSNTHGPSTFLQQWEPCYHHL